MLAGADAVAVGTALFTNPGVAGEVYDGIAEYCARHGFGAAKDICGAANPEGAR